jgi:hypothetical protein
MDRITLENAIRCLEDARRQLRAQYLTVEPHEEGYEEAVAVTLVPENLRGLTDSLHAAYEHLLNLRDSHLAAK